MKKLTLSLIFSVLLASISVGWLLDQAFNYYSQNDEINTDLDQFKVISASLALMLDVNVNREDIIQSWPQKEQPLQISPLSDFPLPESIRQNFLDGEPLTLSSENDLTLNYYLPKAKKVMTINYQDPLVNQQEQTIQQWFTFSFYIGLLGILLIWLYPLLRRLSFLSDAASKFGKGQFDKRISVSSISYIEKIESEFNKMAQRIETLIADKQLLTNAVSHDLRTPLARIQFGLDTLSETVNDAKQHEYLQRINLDVQVMTELVEVLLSYSRLEQKKNDVNFETINLLDYVSNCMEELGLTPEESSLFCDVEKPKIKANSKLLRLLINNILNNAICYGKSQTKIKITETEQCYQLSVEDDGEGFDNEDISALVKPFMRGKKQEQYNPNGFGMGLAIASRISELHQGNLYITQSQDLGGAKVQINFTK